MSLIRSHKLKKYGWIPDLPDQRDFLYAAPTPIQSNLPAKVDLTPQCPPVYDQGQLGSCTANAIAGAIEFDQKMEKLTEFIPSRLFIYFNERTIEGTVNIDSGAMIRDGIKSVANLGACPESDWPYDINNFAEKPPQAAFTNAKQHLVVLYQRLIQELNTLKGCLASGYPFVFGFTVYESFESPEVERTGIMPMPRSSEQPVGGHAVLAVGYDDEARQFIVRNSWGPNWGLDGYFRMPYAYLTNSRLASDLWTIRSTK
ncbi:C1 family peptidase [Myxococcus sp. XM-1-1-1]|uniref:C1 family peptidase n=1 Tax=Myxococcus sp. XM-1-1-1 TaxID=2874602 RepID=UPI001CBCA5C3|nr:C1 family peptidase [Myxococcus sp. XM-1-1-1]MBZ4410713.1 C1 family peptidase [Myxococcus sp. XM-1-1-1]